MRPSIHEFWRTNHGATVRFECDHQPGGLLHRPVSSGEIYPALKRLVDQARIVAHKIRPSGGNAGSLVWAAPHHPAPVVDGDANE